YVESGIPRGSEIIKKGTDKVMQSFRGTPPQPQSAGSPEQPVIAAAAPSPPVAANQQPAGAADSPLAIPVNRQTVAASQPQPFAGRVTAPAVATSAVKNRLAIMEIGQIGLAQPLYEKLQRAAIGGLLDPTQTAFLAQNAPLTNEAEKAVFATRLQQDYGANAIIYLSAPEGVASGKTINAEVYDTMGGGMLRRFDAVISLNDGAEPADRNTAVAPALAEFTEKIRELVAVLPWYGRITAVEGNRAYIAAGKESGLTIGQILHIYHNGKFMKGLGYAPGELIGTLAIQGFVGPNGSFGQIREGQGVQAADLVSVE
ncbi:MAG TPA: hypothetical protein VHN12_07300, partial [Geobacteraceae bacterium]|nr:hypothetical protein [Geobacteraceae bacterium]